MKKSIKEELIIIRKIIKTKKKKNIEIDEESGIDFKLLVKSIRINSKHENEEYKNEESRRSSFSKK